MYHFSIDFNFREFFSSYRWFLLIVGISFFVWRSLRWETDSSKVMLRNGILIGNLYLFLHLFFRPLLHIEPALFILLGLIIWGVIWVARQPWNLRAKRIVYVIWGIFSVGILISGFFYLYPEAPDETGFLAQQQKKLIITSPFSQSKQEAYVLLEPTLLWKIEEITFLAWRQEFLLPETTEVAFISRKPVNSGQVFLLFENGYLLEIFPQQEIALFSGTLAGVSQERGVVVEFFSHPVLDSYVQAFQTYLEQQIWSPFATFSFFHTINTWVLNRLAILFPGFLSENLTPAQRFNEYFQLFYQRNSQENSLISTEKYQVKGDNPWLFEIIKMFFTNAQVFHKVEWEYCITKWWKC